MLLAHLVPSYFATVYSRRTWKPEWTRKQRAILWTAALFSTFAPDLDVIYNALFRGFFNHSTLWTHSLIPHVAIALCWCLLRFYKRLPYLQTLLGLVAIGGLSHLLLDVISHGTPLFYPLSLHMVGAEMIPTRIMDGGFKAYITDPLFLLEPILITLVIGHWLSERISNPALKRLLLIGLTSSLMIFAGLFLIFLPTLQTWAR